MEEKILNTRKNGMAVLLLTLFGDYIGTLKGQGFYWVNPFCTAVNPAAGTRLSQSGDVSSKENGMPFLRVFKIFSSITSPSLSGSEAFLCDIKIISF